MQIYDQTRDAFPPNSSSLGQTRTDCILSRSFWRSTSRSSICLAAAFPAGLCRSLFLRRHSEGVCPGARSTSVGHSLGVAPSASSSRLLGLSDLKARASSRLGFQGVLAASHSAAEELRGPAAGMTQWVLSLSGCSGEGPVSGALSAFSEVAASTPNGLSLCRCRCTFTCWGPLPKGMPCRVGAPGCGKPAAIYDTGSKTDGFVISSDEEP